MRSPTRRFLGMKIVLALVSVVAVCGLAEAVLRLIHYKPGLSSNWVLDSQYRVLDDDLITIDRRYQDADLYKAFEVHAPTKVIVALGDSFTVGIPVDQTDSYPSVLERMLQMESSDVRVMNAGLGDSGPDQHLRLFEKYILPRVHPDIVVWQFHPNDSLDNALKAIFSISDDGKLAPLDARDNWMYRRQRFYNLVPLPVSVKRGSYLFNLMLRRYERGRSAAVPKGKDPTTWGREKIALEVARMSELAEQHSFKLYLALVAPQSTYQEVEKNGPAYWESIEYPKLTAALQAFPNFIDVRFDRAVVEEKVHRGADIFADGTRDSNPIGTRHFNESGYTMMAETVAPYLRNQQAPRSVLSWPRHLVFGDRSTRKWMSSGWYQDESAGHETYVWSRGQRSVLKVPLPPGGDIRMSFECQPLLFSGSPRQTVTITFNDTVVDEIALSPTRHTYSVLLPKAALRAPLNSLEFKYGHTRRLLDVQPNSQDSRELAVAWHWVDFEATGISMLASPTRLTFGDNASRKWMRSGWYQDESGAGETYAWSGGSGSVLELPLPTGTDIRMTFDCKPYRFPDNPQQIVSVVLNGTVFQRVPLRPDRQRYDVVLPKAAARSGVNTLEFRYAYARQPKDVEANSQDTRALAVAWYSIELTAAGKP